MSVGKKVSMDLALEVIKVSKELKKKREYDLASQIFRSGCSIGANIREAQSAESDKDFIHKLKIADKEAHETEYWLELTQLSEGLDTKLAMSYTKSIIKILGKSISTVKNKIRRSENPNLQLKGKKQ